MSTKHPRLYSGPGQMPSTRKLAKFWARPRSGTPRQSLSPS
jgi:hypothetical protein